MFQQSCEQQKNIPYHRRLPCSITTREKNRRGGKEYLIWKLNFSCAMSLGMLWQQPNDFFWNFLQMIALVMDSFTDTDIFKDLLEACSQRQVKAYILLDQSSFSHFLKMCKDLGVDLEREKVSLVIFLGIESWSSYDCNLWAIKRRNCYACCHNLKWGLCSSSSFLEDLTILA